MTHYRLLRDMPTLPAGAVFTLDPHPPRLLTYCGMHHTIQLPAEAASDATWFRPISEEIPHAEQ